MDEANETLVSQLTLLTRPQTYLRRLGIRDVEQHRLQETWHDRPLSGRWATTIGMWGGVATHTEIMSRADASYTTMNMFRQRNALTTRPSRAQWDLAASVYLRWKLDDEKVEQVPAIAAHFGILPIELRIYIDRMKLVLIELGVQEAELLETEYYRQVEELWLPHSETIDGLVISTYAHLR